MTDAPEAPALKRTPLFDLHRKLGAKMVPFAGYQMPLQYEGILAEHNHCRREAVLFDVSHMGMALLQGDDVATALETLVVGDIRGLAAGRLRYTLLTNDEGGIVDDLMVINGGYYVVLVVNAARKEVDFALIRDRIGDRIDFEVWTDRALLALQGPAAASVLARLAPPSRHMLFMTMETLTIGEMKCGVTRSGYTGEDGFEIVVDDGHAVELANMILDEPEVMPAGLGARDTLRLEAGLCLYGQDLDETTTPVEAGLAWTIGQRRREEGGFPGDEIILRQMAEGPKRKRVGINLQGKVPARAGAAITDRWGKALGRVTSGTFGPTVGAPIAMGYVSADHADNNALVSVTVRERPLPGRVVPMPFVPHRYAT
ncbi:MAG: glycine cleavage system aminomethyltransferase GcvT [Rhodospirillales bacterium]|nr:MAG: glycine cleavage system aminomethyltransferase GcvT [Rhodospirillales bacterium]